MHGGKWSGVLHRAEEQKHADCDKPVHPEPRCERPAGGDFLYAHNSP